MKNKYLEEVTKALGPQRKQSKAHARYVGAQGHEKRNPDEQSSLVFYGLSVPEQRKIAQSKLSFSHLPEDEQWGLWMNIWRQSSIYEVKSIALMWIFDKKRLPLRLKLAKDIFSIAEQIDNWAHSDSLSGAIAELIDFNKNHLRTLEKWNRSKNPWLRRQSIVGIYYYARMRQSHVPAKKALAMIKPLLLDPHFYVQRGVGWTLREIDRVDSAAQRNFVKANLKNISSTAWFATSELYPASLRKELVRLRKKQASID